MIRHIFTQINNNQENEYRATCLKQVGEAAIEEVSLR